MSVYLGTPVGKPFCYTLQSPAMEESRCQSNHRPNAYARLSTVHAHLESMRKACAIYAEMPATFRIYKSGELLEEHELPMKQTP